jgi:hypothetical protein
MHFTQGRIPFYIAILALSVQYEATSDMEELLYYLLRAHVLFVAALKGLDRMESYILKQSLSRCLAARNGFCQGRDSKPPKMWPDSG